MKDPNFRIFTDRDTITVFNDELFMRGTDIQDIFAQLGVDDATHAFYLGRELTKAKLAITLGKTYRQEGSLSWGYLTPPDDVKSEHVKLAPRRRRRAPPEGRVGTMSDASRRWLRIWAPTGDPIEVGARFLDLPYLLFLDSATGASLTTKATGSAAIPSWPRTRACRPQQGRAHRARRHRTPSDRVEAIRSSAVREILAPVRGGRGVGLPPFQGGAAGYIGTTTERCSSACPRRDTTISRSPTCCSASTIG